MELRELTERLSQYSGGYGRLWDFSPTHNRLVIELADSANEDRTYLVLLGTTRIQIPTAWRLEKLELVQDRRAMVARDKGVEVRFEYEAQLQRDYSRA
jgi:hypothetical protein